MYESFESLLATHFRQVKLHDLNDLYVSVYGEVFNTKSWQFCSQYSSGTQRLAVICLREKERFDVPVRILVINAWDDVDIADIPKNTKYLKFLLFSRIYRQISDDDKKLVDSSWIPNYKDQPGRGIYICRNGTVWSEQNEFPYRLRHPDNGYIYLSLCSSIKTPSNKQDRFKLAVHRLVAMAFNPIPQRLLDLGYTFDTLTVNHINGDKHDNNANNLEWATTQENNQHAIKTGLTTPRKEIHIEPDYSGVLSLSNKN